MRLLDDNPTTEDALGFRESADRVFDVITHLETRPVAIGIFGGWGSGKTSLMKMVEAKLDAEGIKTVWFNAWKYDGKEAIWNAFIQTILLKMKEDDAFPATDFKARVIAVSKELAKFAAKVGTRVVPGGILRPEDVDGFLEAISSSADDDLFQFINQFEVAFGRLVAEWVGGDGYVVVFVDDLDRCLPENAVEVLEALKLYLDQASCVFVIGVEPAIVEEAIKRRYGDHPALSQVEYLEKIIQIPFVLPRVRAKAALHLAAGQGIELSATEEAELKKLIIYGLDRNPRRVKRLFNALTLASLDEATASEKDRLALAKVLVLQMRFPSFYRALRRDPGLVEKLEKGSDEWPDSDADVRTFIGKTKAIKLDAKAARKCIRVAGRTPAEDGDEVSASSAAG
jgi:predicted KAP-like P-loop ATPase